jgi:hypothetical protein
MKISTYCLKLIIKNYILDAFPRRSGDHLAQNFLRKIKLIFQLFFIENQRAYVWNNVHTVITESERGEGMTVNTAYKECSRLYS